MPSPAARHDALPETGVRAMIRLVGDVVASRDDYAGMLRAAAHPDLAWISEMMIRDMRAKESQVTRLREQLAAALGLPENTVATHKKGIYGQFGVSSHASLRRPELGLRWWRP